MRLVMIITKVDEDDSIYGANISWITSLARRIDRLTVIGMSVGKHSFPENTVVYSLGKEHNYNRLHRLLRFEAIMLRLLVTRRVDGVFVHQGQIWGPLLAYCRILRIPVVLFKAHGRLPKSIGFYLPFFDRVFSTTSETFPYDTPKKIAVGQGIDVERFRKLSNGVTPDRDGEGVRIVSVGRLSPIKGHEVLVDAAARLVHNAGLPVFFHVYGEPYLDRDHTYVEQLQRQIGSLDLEERLLFHGVVPNSEVPLALNGATLYVNPSVGDSALDKSVLEAMACEVPVVTSNEKFRDLFGPYVDLLYFPKGDAAQLTERIQALLNLDEGQRQVIGSYLRQVVVEHHNVDNLMARVVESIEACKRKPAK